MPSRSLLSSAGVLLAAALLWGSGAFGGFSLGRLVWAALLLLGFLEGLLARDPGAPRLSSAVAVLFLFRAAQPWLGQRLLDGGWGLSAGAAGSLSYVLTAAPLALLGWRALRGEPWRREPRWREVVVVGLLGGALSSLVLALFFWGVPPSIEAATPPDLYWLLALFWAASPLWEELCFRGLLFRSLHARSRDRAWFSVCVSAAVFALMHERALLPPIFALGIVCALSYIRTRTLVAPMIAHLLHNITAWYLGAF